MNYSGRRREPVQRTLPRRHRFGRGPLGSLGASFSSIVAAAALGNISVGIWDCYPKDS